MKIAVVSLFPEMFSANSEYGVVGRAIDSGLVEFQVFNPRSYTKDKHQTVDSRPYGGGPGMVMMVEPLLAAVSAAKSWCGESAVSQVIYLSPQGSVLCQHSVHQLAEGPNMVLVAGRYEGVDERFINLCVDRELSLGDYVISGGELAAMVVVDAVVRLLPGVLGHAESALQDSFQNGMLDWPHYTRPECIEGLEVPRPLLSGNHRVIEQWREKQSLGRTWARRPDLLQRLSLSEQSRELLQQYQLENGGDAFDLSAGEGDF